MVYGQKWSNTEAPKALAYYCGYITLLALNGCTEAYVNAVADPRYLTLSFHQQLMQQGWVQKLYGGTVGVMQCPAPPMRLSKRSPKVRFCMVSTHRCLAE